MNLFDLLEQEAPAADTTARQGGGLLDAIGADALDLLAPAAGARSEQPVVDITEPAAPAFTPGVRVRHADGRTGRVFLSVPATDRVCVRFLELERAEFVNRIDLMVIGPACDCRTWKNTETVWPGETFSRPTKTCVDCGEVRGRA